MPLKTHHKWLIGSFSTLVIIFMVTSSIFMYTIFVRQEVNYNTLNGKIVDLQTETQSNVNTLSTSLIQIKGEVTNLSSEFGSINQEFSSLKASVSSDFSNVIDNTVKSVVTIKTDLAQGTGFIITKDGYVVTNYHVMENAKAATIITSDNENHAVSLIGYDSDIDIALLKISGNYQELELGDSNDVTVGEKVIAIGNPLGLQFSVSQGIISAVHRAGPNGLEAYMQTDAALNPGNSGGPLIDTNGKVIGINNFKIGDSESLGFALESNYIKKTVNDIYQQGQGVDLI